MARVSWNTARWPGESGFHLSRRIVVKLDGVPQRKVFAYDVERGEVVRAVLDPNGRMQVDPSDRSQVWAETLHGVVTVEPKAEAA